MRLCCHCNEEVDSSMYAERKHRGRWFALCAKCTFELEDIISKFLEPNLHNVLKTSPNMDVNLQPDNQNKPSQE